MLTNNSFNNKKVARIDKTDTTTAARLPAIKNLYLLFFRNIEKREMQMAAIPSPRLKERLPKIDIIQIQQYKLIHPSSHPHIEMHI